MSDKNFDVRPIAAGDKGWIVETLETHWNSTMMVSRGVLHDISAQTNALARSRELKPGIPIIGMDGILLRDEIELEMALG